MDALSWSRYQFGFAITFHYLFPQLTMGLALIIVLFKAMALRRGDERYHDAARFWGRIFAVSFALGVVTGIPMEFQFGTNWGRFSNYAGGVIGLTLAMEGLFAFFAESAFLGLFLFAEKRLGPRGHLLAALMMFLGSWLSGYFIITTNAFMQHPVGYSIAPGGGGRPSALQLSDFWGYLLNPWALWQYAHNMSAAVITSSFVVAAVGAYWMLMGTHQDHARIFLKVGVTLGFLFSVLQLFPTGDQQGKLVAKHQPVTLAGMEGKFETGDRAELAIIGQPDLKRRRLENPIVVPGMLSYLAYGSFGATVKGLNDFPRDQWSDNVVLLYYVYHIMVGLGTMFLALMGTAVLCLWRGKLYTFRPILWALMLAFPFPYIATTAGWMTAELGRQPWLVHGLFRTTQGTSPYVSGGDVAFSTLGFMGMYALLMLLFLYLIVREISRGPRGLAAAAPGQGGGEESGESTAQPRPGPASA
jgi:cytochrome d ubiquinol oxidase subunit I